MRELHLKLRSLSTEDNPARDCDRYPFLKELIGLDKKLHSNWETYDHYTGTEDVGTYRRLMSRANRRWRGEAPSHDTQGMDYAPCTKSSALARRQYMVLVARRARLALRPPRCVPIFLLT